MSSLLEKTLVIGATGQLGTDVVRVFKRVTDVVAPARPALDIEDAHSVSVALRRYAPTLVINTAAYHNVELCESFPDKAFKVNALAVANLAIQCASLGIAFAHMSTDYVFDGLKASPYLEADAASPINMYGVSKLAGELATRVYSCRHFIFRTSGLYGTTVSSKGHTFIDRMLSLASKNETLRVVDDITFSPSYTVDVAELILRVVRSGNFGTYHVTNAGSTTWYQFTKAAFKIRGVTAQVLPSKSDNTPGSIKRPRFSALAHQKLHEAGISDAPTWEDGLAKYLSERP